MDDSLPEVELLEENLTSQLTLYKELLLLVREEKDYVVQTNIKEIRKITLAKEVLLGELHKKEMERQKWLLSLANATNQDVEKLSLEAVARLYPQYPSIMKLRNSLRIIVTRVHSFNQENGRLVENALEETQEMKKNALAVTEDKSPTYNPRGKMHESGDRNARIVSEKV